MRFMVFVKASDQSEAGEMPTREMIEPMGKFNEEMSRAGILLAMDGLAPTSQGARIRFDGAKRSVTDGPFAEAKELVAGYWLIEVKSKAEAIEWMSRAPFEDGEIELRRVFEPEDFGEELAADVRRHHEELNLETYAPR